LFYVGLAAVNLLPRYIGKLRTKSTIIDQHKGRENRLDVKAIDRVRFKGAAVDGNGCPIAVSGNKLVMSTSLLAGQAPPMRTVTYEDGLVITRTSKVNALWAARLNTLLVS